MTVEAPKPVPAPDPKPMPKEVAKAHAADQQAAKKLADRVQREQASAHARKPHERDVVYEGRGVPPKEPRLKPEQQQFQAQLHTAAEKEFQKSWEELSIDERFSTAAKQLDSMGHHALAEDVRRLQHMRSAVDSAQWDQEAQKIWGKYGQGDAVATQMQRELAYKQEVAQMEKQMAEAATAEDEADRAKAKKRKKQQEQEDQSFEQQVREQQKALQASLADRAQEIGADAYSTLPFAQKVELLLDQARGTVMEGQLRQFQEMLAGDPTREQLAQVEEFFNANEHWEDPAEAVLLQETRAAFVAHMGRPEQMEAYGLDGEQLGEYAMNIRDIEVDGKTLDMRGGGARRQRGGPRQPPPGPGPGFNPRGPDFYRTTNAAFTPQESAFMEGVQNQLDLDPASGEDPSFWRGQIRALQRQGILTGSAQQIVDELRAQQFQAEQRIQLGREAASRKREYSSIFLSPEETFFTQGSPEGGMEEYIRKSSLNFAFFPEKGAAEEAQRRIDLITSYFSSAQYKTDVLGWLKRNPAYAGQTDAQLMQTEVYKRNTGEDYIKFLSDKAGFRLGAQRIYGMIRATGDTEGVKKSLLNFGTAGLQFMLNENGALTGEFYNVYHRVFREMVRDQHGNIQEILGRQLTAVEDKVVKEILDNQHLYKGTYQNYWRDRIPDGMESEIMNFNERTVRAIVRDAEFVHAMLGQDVVAIQLGLNPHETGGAEQFTMATTAEKYGGAMDLRLYFRKWFFLKEGQLVMWENMARGAAKAHGLEPLIAKEIDAVWGDAQAREKLLRRTFSIPNHLDAVRDAGEIRGKLANEFQYTDKGRKWHAPTTLAEVTRAQLEDRMRVYRGEEYTARMLSAYTYFDSGYIVGTHLSQLKEVYGEDAAKHMGLGLRLRGIGSDLIGAESHHAKEEALHKLEHLLKDEIANYRPQATMEFMFHAEDEEFLRWVRDNHGLIQGAFAEPLAAGRADLFLSEVGKRAIAINAELARKGLPQIDFSQGVPLTDEQRNVVNRICGSMNMTTAQRAILDETALLGLESNNANGTGFLNLMKQMTVFAGSHHAIHEMTSARYHEYYWHTQWEDDARLSYLERTGDINPHPDPTNQVEKKKAKETYDFRKFRAPGMVAPKADDPARVPLSARFAYKGRGAGDALVRTWGDLDTAVKSMEMVRGALTADPKRFMENVVKVHDSILQVYGYKPWATREVAYFLMGYGKTMKADVLADYLLLTDAPGMSAAKRLFGPHADALGLNEIDHLIETAGLEIGGQLKLIIPEMTHEMEEFLGITFGPHGGIGELKIPLQAYRARLFIVLAMVLMAAELKKGADEAGGGGGGHH